jgi:hypothetical protein
VRITGVSEAPIPWPLGQLLKGGRRPALVLYGDLAKAVKRESAEAVMHFWGVKANTVWTWRKALGVPQYNQGTTALKSELLSPWLDEIRPAAIAVAGSAERREKIAASGRGKPRPPHVIEAVRKVHAGRAHTEEARRKMSEASRKRGALVPGTRLWTAREDALVRTLPAEQVARKTRRTLAAVYARRRELKLPDGRSARPVRGARLSEAQMLLWARTYHAEKGSWPSAESPPVGLPEGESWRNLDKSLRFARRGLPGGSSLSRLLRPG